MDKSGGLGNQLHLFSFFFLLLIVSGSVVLGYSMYIGSGYDTRQNAAEDLQHTIIDCLDEFGLIENLLEKCNVNAVIAENEGFLLRICLDECIQNVKPEIFFGSNYQACDLNTVDYSYPKCTKSNIKLDNGNYQVISGSARVPEVSK